jgi:hypothetical protein
MSAIILIDKENEMSFRGLVVTAILAVAGYFYFVSLPPEEAEIVIGFVLGGIFVLGIIGVMISGFGAKKPEKKSENFEDRKRGIPRVPELKKNRPAKGYARGEDAENLYVRDE